MATAATTPKGFSDKDLVSLMALIRGSDSVELKLTVPESDQRSTIVALGLDPLQAQIRQVFFFDTPELALNAKGVVVRARRIQGKGDDSVVKLRPVVPDELPAALRRLPGFGVEVRRGARWLRLLGQAEGGRRGHRLHDVDRTTPTPSGTPPIRVTHTSSGAPSRRARPI